MSGKWTPGPWKVIQAGNQWAVVKAKAKRSDDDIAMGSTYHDEWKENARLIASAPAMADALEAIRKLTVRNGSTGATLDEIHEIAVAALSQALGEGP